MQDIYKQRWIRFWMRYAGPDRFGRLATRMATIFSPPYYGRTYLSNLNTKGYIAPSAIVHHNNVRFGHNVFIGDHVVIYQFKNGGSIEFDDRVKIFGHSFLQTGSGGNIQIGENTDIHYCCQISAYKSDICIGSQVQVAPNCAFYPYNHGMMPGKSMREQPLQSKGDIIIGDGAWRVEFTIENTGPVTLESISVHVLDTITDEQTGISTMNSFMAAGGCDLVADEDLLFPGESGYTISFDLSADPTDHYSFATIKACTQENLEGNCLVREFNFTP